MISQALYKMKSAFNGYFHIKASGVLQKIFRTLILKLGTNFFSNGSFCIFLDWIFDFFPEYIDVIQTNLCWLLTLINWYLCLIMSLLAGKDFLHICIE